MNDLQRFAVWLNTGDNHIKAGAAVLLAFVPVVLWLTGDYSPIL